MAQYLIDDNGGFQYVTPITQSTGVSDANKIAQTGSDGKLDSSLFPDGIGADVQVAPASETLAAGAFVNLWNDSGTLKLRNADASGGKAKKAHGYVKAAVSSGANGTMYKDGFNSQLSSLTIAGDYYLSGTTPGAVTDTAPTTATYITQYLGKAVSATSMLVNIGPHITRV